MGPNDRGKAPPDDSQDITVKPAQLLAQPYSGGTDPG